jgi:type IV pilus assembly protein PilA
MMSWFAKKMRETYVDDGGFTLIEILVVVILIGILVSIAFPVFLNQREKAHVATVKSNVRNAVLADTMRRSGTGSGVLPDTYTEGENVGDAENQFRVSKGVTITVTATEIEGTHAGLSAADSWTYDKSTGAYTGTGVFNQRD